MAKKVTAQAPPTNGYALKKVTAEHMRETISALRSGSGSRTSKYLPIADALPTEIVTAEDVLQLDLDKNEVGGLRGYIKRRFGYRYMVESVKSGDGDKHKTFIRLATAAEITKAKASEAKVAAKGTAESQPAVQA